MRIGDDFPQLRFLMWNRADGELTDAEAFELYETNRQWVDRAAMTERERDYFERLVVEIGRGVFLG